MAQRYQAIRGWIAGVLVLINLVGFSPKSLAAAAETPRQEIQRIFDRLEESHGLHLVWENIDAFKRKDISFEAISGPDVPRFLSFLRVFQEEIDRYPADFFKPSGLTRVIFVKKLFKQSEPAHGVYQLPMGHMYFDIYRTFRNKQVQRHSIHHEIF